MNRPHAAVGLFETDVLIDHRVREMEQPMAPRVRPNGR
jgi:hypothetical protein